VFKNILHLVALNDKCSKLRIIIIKFKIQISAKIINPYYKNVFRINL